MGEPKRGSNNSNIGRWCRTPRGSDHKGGSGARGRNQAVDCHSVYSVGRESAMENLGIGKKTALCQAFFLGLSY